MKCPNNGDELVRETYEANVEIDRCASCRGIWLDAKELERIQDISQRDYSAEIKQLPNLVDQAYAMALAKSKPTISCPNCGDDQSMERREHGGCSQILIDVCPKCQGVWLDDGEISALEIFFERAEADTEEIRTGFFASLKNLLS